MRADIKEYIEIAEPCKYWSRAEILVRPCPVPRLPGVYGWYFREIPPGVPTEHCISHDGLTLYYVGIAPSQGVEPAGQNLASRIYTHLCRTARRSTLRLSLGCLLGDQLGIQLQKTKSGKHFTFGEGEKLLSDWMSENAFVTWVTRNEPWILEEHLIKTLSLPLNLRGNESHPFHPVLAEMRRKCKQQARDAEPPFAK